MVPSVGKGPEAEDNMSHGVESPGQTFRWGVGRHDAQEVVEQHPEYQGPAKWTLSPLPSVRLSPNLLQITLHWLPTPSLNSYDCFAFPRCNMEVKTLPF